MKITGYHLTVPASSSINFYFQRFSTLKKFKRRFNFYFQTSTANHLHQRSDRGRSFLTYTEKILRFVLNEILCYLSCQQTQSALKKETVYDKSHSVRWALWQDSLYIETNYVHAFNVRPTASVPAVLILNEATTPGFWLFLSIFLIHRQHMYGK